jgi:hypothetical protein
MNPDRLGTLQIVDDDGGTWHLRKKRIQLRVVRRLIKDPSVRVVLGEAGGTLPRAVSEDERAGLWDSVRTDYMGPGGDWATGAYLAHEFRTDADDRMLFVEEHC